jgi:hypothetical protein
LGMYFAPEVVPDVLAKRFSFQRIFSLYHFFNIGF